MPGKNRYSMFSDSTTEEQKARKTFLEKVFSKNNPLAGEEYTHAKMSAIADKFLTAINADTKGLQQGDPQMFPLGVHLDYGASPDVSQVDWNKAGDPLSAYVPDVRSPGNPELLPQDEAPEITEEDIKPTYTRPVGLPPKETLDKGTYNPALTGPAIHNSAGALELGVSIKQG